MLALRLGLRNATSVVASAFYWILNADASATGGRNYAWMDEEVWTDANKWKDTGL